MNINFSLLDFVKLIIAAIIALGGPTVIILGLSKWFGEYLSERMLVGVKNKHEKQLESLKSEYQKELEITKTELEKTKTQFLRYSEKQFELYNDLWRVLMSTKNQADSLWEEPALEKIPAFSEQIRLTRKAVEDSMLLIEEAHYKKLQTLIVQFEQFRFGKIKLIDIRPQNQDNANPTGLTSILVKRAIRKNENIKKKYDKLIMEIGKSFRDQIKG